MRKKRIPLAVQLAVCEQLSQVLAAGFNLRQSLQVVTLTFDAQAAVWTAVDLQLSAGTSLAESLAANHFHPQIVAQLALAEHHGQLADALHDAAELVRVQTESRHKLRQLMVYPLILLALLAVIQTVLLVGVLPMLGSTHASFVQTELLGAAAVLVLAAGSWLGLRRLTAVERAGLWQKVPVIRTLAINYYRYQFVSGLAQYLAAGLPLITYVGALSEAPNNPLRPVGQSVQARLEAGEPLQAALEHPLIYAPARQLLMLGQPPKLVQAGMTLFAKQLLKQFGERVERWLAAVQPVMFILIGLQIVMMYRELLLPLYDHLGGLP